MKKYEKYKESGIEWLGDIPEHWEATKMKWMTPVYRGASPRPIADTKYFDENGEFAWVRIADVSASKRYLEHTTERLSELGASLSVKRYPGDLFLSIAGSVGKPIITKIKCCIHDGFVWFPELKINPEYLFYVFQTGLPFIGLGKVGTQLNLNTDTIGNIFIPKLSDSDYNSIVNYLDHKTTQIDTLIEKKEQLIDKLKLQHQAIINEAVTKGLNPNASMKDSGIEWLGEIPKHWELKKLKYILDVKGRIGFRGYTTDDLVEKGEGALSLGASHINWEGDIVLDSPVYISWDKYFESPEIMVDKGDILIVQRGSTCGKVGIVSEEIDKATINPSLVVLKRISGVPEYVFYNIKASITQLTNLIRSAAIPMISQEQIGNIQIPFPPMKEQKEIAEQLLQSKMKFESVIGASLQSIEKIKLYRQSIISEAVTGKIDVRDWVKPENNN
ncbi:MAG: restriction endonuclease subunit S [Carboxylicivirga sp.]|jgi:type I restriction enzyme S subunit|nr:restriction endonuclease subunit S [Carboxylicivirga sp.]